MAKIIDLDEILGEDKQAKLGGKVYKLPPDLPVELYLKITSFDAEKMGDREITETMYSEILELFRYKAPDLESLPISMTQAAAVITLVYGQAEEEAETPVRPPRQRRSGGTTSGSKTRK